MGNKASVPAEVDWSPVQSALHSKPADEFMAAFHGALAWVGIPRPYPDIEQVFLSLAVMAGTLTRGSNQS